MRLTESGGAFGTHELSAVGPSGIESSIIDLLSKQDIATKYSDAYFRAAPFILKDIHEFLLKTLESHFSQNPNGNLLIAGPGGGVHPYSCSFNGRQAVSGRDKIKQMLGNGNIVLLDYVLDENDNGLMRSRKTLLDFGFFTEGYFKEGHFNPEFLDNEIYELGHGQIHFLLNDLRKPLRCADSMFSAIDATLSIHHASHSINGLGSIYREVNRMLVQNGLFHLGEGHVDMSYREEKAEEIAKDICEMIGMPVMIYDAENAHMTTFGKDFFPNSEDFAQITLESTGNCTFNYLGDPNDCSSINRELERGLRKKGYNVTIFKGGITMALIDPASLKDTERHIMPINRFYDYIRNRSMELLEPDVSAKICEGIENERGCALKGLVEHYIGEDKIIAALKGAGFNRITRTHHEEEPFYNIVCYKI